MKGFAGASDPVSGLDSAFSIVFAAGHEMTNSDFNKLMQSRLIVTTTQFKWQTFALHRLKRRLFLFVGHCMLATLALLVSTSLPHEGGSAYEEELQVRTTPYVRVSVSSVQY